jgi:cellulose synthase/poly-beta-1,6-N-acetylglucosamine synthase-like glycosyltransferase
MAILIWAMAEPIIKFTESNDALTVMSNFKLLAADGQVSRSVIALGALLLFAVVVNLFALVVSLFSNFELQKRTTILSMLILAGYYVLLLIYSFILLDDASLEVDLPVLFPFFGIILNSIAFNLIRREEARIIARASGFRLRD